MVDRARANEKIEFLTPTSSTRCSGDDEQDDAACASAHVETGETRELEADGLFVAIGHDPNTALFLDWLDHDEAGYLVTQARLDRDEHPGRLRRRRRPGPHLPPGGHRRRLRLHGRARRRALARRARGHTSSRPRRPALVAPAGRGASVAARMAAATAGSTCSTRLADELRRAAPGGRPRPGAEQLLAPAAARGRAAAEARGPRRLRLRHLPRRRSPSPDEDASTTRRSISSSRATCSSRSGRRRRTAGHPCDPHPAQEACRHDDTAGMIAYHLIDDIAERYLDLVDDAERGDRRARGPRRGVDRRADVAPRLSEPPPRHPPHPPHARADARRRPRDRRQPRSSSRASEVLHARRRARFGDAYDKLLRAADGLELVPRPGRRRPRLLPGEDRERPERGDEAADRRSPRCCSSRRSSSASTARTSTTSRSSTGVCGYAVVLGLIIVDDDRPALVLPPEEVDLRATSATLAACRYFICPNCKERSIDIDGLRGLSTSRRRLPSLRLRLPVRADGRLLPRRRTRVSSSATRRGGCSRRDAASSS